MKSATEYCLNLLEDNVFLFSGPFPVRIASRLSGILLYGFQLTVIKILSSVEVKVEFGGFDRTVD